MAVIPIARVTSTKLKPRDLPVAPFLIVEDNFIIGCLPMNHGEKRVGFTTLNL